MEDTIEALKAGLPVRDFLLYVTANKSLINTVQDSSTFSLHVSSVMEASWHDPQEKFQDSSVGKMSQSTKREIENGFPLLYANTLIGLWGALEACIDDLCLLWLQCLDREDLGEALGNSRARVGEYLSLDDGDRWLWILMQLQKSDGASLRAGVGQFESVLKPLGILPEVEGGVRTTLFRIKAMRNLYAHRAGRADEKFLRDWPEHPARVGETVYPTEQQFLAAHTAMVLYVEGVHDRILEELGEPLPNREFPPWIETTEDLLPLLTPNTNIPEGAPWSYHLSEGPDDGTPN